MGVNNWNIVEIDIDYSLIKKQSFFAIATMLLGNYLQKQLCADLLIVLNSF